LNKKQYILRSSSYEDWPWTKSLPKAKRARGVVQVAEPLPGKRLSSKSGTTKRKGEEYILKVKEKI
jgi:hypothetical protein